MINKSLGATAFDDAAGNSYAGISANTDLRFTTIDGTAPVFTSSSTATIAENQTNAIDVNATDNTSISYSISGVDASAFTISATTGEVTFTQAPDFENPIDSNADNSYQLTVTATDATSNSTSQAVTIVVTDIDEIEPSITISASSSSRVMTANQRTDDPTLTITFTLSEAAAAAPNDFSVGDIDVINGTLGNDFSCLNLTCSVTLEPIAVGQVQISVAANSFTDSAGNNNIASDAFLWTYGTQPTNKVDVIKSVEAGSSKGTEFSRQSFRAVSSRFQWAKSNTNPAMRSYQGIRLRFADPYVDELFNGTAQGVDVISMTDVALQLRSYGNNNGDVDGSALQTNIEKQAARLALAEARTKLGLDGLHSTAGPLVGNWSIWTEGQITVGEYFQDSSSSAQNSDGMSVTIGMDKPMKESSMIGGALTFGKSETTIGNAGSQVDSDNISLVFYSGFETANKVPMEFSLGGGRMTFDNVRIDGQQTLLGLRRGNSLFASAKVYESHIQRGNVSFTPYGLLEVSRVWLDAYAESGGNLALEYDQQTMDQAMISFGTDINYLTYYRNGKLSPFATLEVGADLSGTSDAVMRYKGQADDYRLRMDKLSDYHWLLRTGFDYQLTNVLRASLSIERYEAVGAGHADTLRFKLSNAF